ncbi:phosphoglyceromutase [bacterium]|jgi:2,3-bisphosphoglycerate-independent phosphoglycerate mutase|nr:phosphoglyceromutase [bacterium]MBT3581523.1 phosphoglyceromutase [bacterium]MBT4551521.1 phosphoglyceromutase [bacterium]MBT5988511.1 phosphoglyceromutase [bacterium]MBT7087529.1 phosphoglyceromutase [bacterium]
MSYIFIFIDGLGLGTNNVHNPFTKLKPFFLEHYLANAWLEQKEIYQKDLCFKGIDARLDVQGIPQSATGQVSLFTGVNAAKVLGYHLTAYPKAPLIEVLNQASFLKKAKKLGRFVTFANPYTKTYFENVKQGKRKHTASTLSVISAKLPFRTVKDLLNQQAVSWDITNELIKQYAEIDIPIYSPQEAGQNLVGLTQNFDLVFYETFLTDLLGHHKDYYNVGSFLKKLDQFLNSVLKYKNNNTTVVLSSDHGNVEDLSTGRHTLNPVPLLAIGPGANYFHKTKTILDVPICLLKALSTI